jgi:L-lactate dehydrogenase complex protein LldG
MDEVARLSGAGGENVPGPVARAREGACLVSVRTAILDRVRHAQRTGRIPVATGVAVAQPVRAAGSDSSASDAGPKPCATNEYVERFRAELAALGVESFVESSADEVHARVKAIVGGRSVLAWDARQLPYDVDRVLAGAARGSSQRDAQAAAQIGVTGCDAAIAETGSLVLLSGGGKPRTASLLPPIHLAIVRETDLRGSIGEFFSERALDIADAACCTIVTGPSRTADIELTLTLGVHGPGQVIVVIGP